TFTTVFEGSSLVNGKEGRSWRSLVPYTLEELKRHIESLFTEGMTWERLINGEIHIDHVMPRRFFYFTTFKDEDFKKCWALSNLQPLWAPDNCSKGDKLPDGTRARDLCLSKE
ncbi:MAG: hypothetical protein AABY22_30710, partial [Nanoarchaeota archaeon]